MTVISQHLDDKKREHGTPLIDSISEEKHTDVESGAVQKTKSKTKCLLLSFLLISTILVLIRVFTCQYYSEQFDALDEEDSEKILMSVPKSQAYLFFTQNQRNRIDTSEAEEREEIERLWSTAEPEIKRKYEAIAEQGEATFEKKILGILTDGSNVAKNSGQFEDETLDEDKDEEDEEQDEDDDI